MEAVTVVRKENGAPQGGRTQVADVVLSKRWACLKFAPEPIAVFQIEVEANGSRKTSRHCSAIAVAGPWCCALKTQVLWTPSVSVSAIDRGTIISCAQRTSSRLCALGCALALLGGARWHCAAHVFIIQGG
jgi:hypothetical protein